MKWLYRLDYKFHNYYIPHLMTIIIAGMAMVFAFEYATPYNVMQALALNRTAILQNYQVWRLVTFLFIPTSTQPFWLLISLYFYWFIGNTLQATWGGFRFSFFYVAGWLGAIISMFITGYGSNTYLNLSLFLAFATIAPDTQFRIFFLIPIKAKWMALVNVVFIALDLLQAFTYGGLTWGLIQLVCLAFSLVNYFIFFGQGLIETVKTELQIRKQRRQWRNNWRQ